MEYYCLNMIFVFCEYVKFLFLLIKCCLKYDFYLILLWELFFLVIWIILRVYVYEVIVLIDILDDFNMFGIVVCVLYFKNNFL